MGDSSVEPPKYIPALFMETEKGWANKKGIIKTIFSGRNIPKQIIWQTLSSMLYSMQCQRIRRKQSGCNIVKYEERAVDNNVGKEKLDCMPPPILLEAGRVGKIMVTVGNGEIMNPIPTRIALQGHDTWKQLSWQGTFSANIVSSFAKPYNEVIVHIS